MNDQSCRLDQVGLAGSFMHSEARSSTMIGLGYKALRPSHTYAHSIKCVHTKIQVVSSYMYSVLESKNVLGRRQKSRFDSTLRFPPFVATPPSYPNHKRYKAVLPLDS